MTIRSVEQLIAASRGGSTGLLEPLSGGGTPEVGRIYLGLTRPDRLPQRLVVTAAAGEGEGVTVKFLDSSTAAVLGVEQLRHCPPQLLSAPPAAVSAASLTLKTR